MPPALFSRIRERWAVAKGIFGRPWPRRVLLAWAALGTWDTFLSQFIPTKAAERFPKAYEVVAMTSDLLPWWGWLVVGALLLAGISFEYAFRQSRKVVPKGVAGVSTKPIIASASEPKLPPPTALASSVNRSTDRSNESKSEKLIATIRLLYAENRLIVLDANVRCHVAPAGPPFIFGVHKLIVYHERGPVSVAVQGATSKYALTVGSVAVEHHIMENERKSVVIHLSVYGSGDFFIKLYSTT